MVLWACGTTISQTRDSTFALSFDPPANSHLAPLTSNLTADMDGTVDESAVDSTTFVIHRGFHSPVNGFFSFPAEHIVFDPSSDFHPGELVSTTLTAGIEVNGVPIDPYVWRFRTKVDHGSSHFVAGQLVGNARTNAAPLGDLDNDGDLDFLTGNWAIYPANVVWKNNGNGTFTQGQEIGNSDTEGVVFGDLDGDGDLDVVFANRSDQPDEVWMNDGTGRFTDSGQRLGNYSSWDLAIGDLDGDGDLDLFVVTSVGNRVWLNDGHGIFTDSGQRLGSSQSMCVALGDLDGDGDLDAFVANNGPNMVWFNDGHGIFTDSGQRLGAENSFGVALGDIDGDGDLDALVANGNPPQPNEVYRNDGTGRFAEIQSVGDSYTRGVALGDLDGDGDLDAYDANRGPDKVWINDGMGTFLDSGQSLGDSTSNGVNVALGDLNGDGTLDAVAAGGTYLNGQNLPGPSEVWLNLPANITEEEEAEKRSIWGLGPASPNPFALQTKIAFSVPKGKKAALRVYDASGRLVKVLSGGVHNSSITWDGKDESMRRLPNGVYFYRLEAGSYIDTRKLVIAG